MATIYKKYQQLKAEQPNLRARNAAEALGISEGELVAAMVGNGVVRLADDAEAILKDVFPLGSVMALTRNDACVHERHGIYDNSEFSKHGRMAMGLFVNPDIDLRLFMNHWKYSFAVHEGNRKSLQFFDKQGDAIHKIYVTAKSNEDAYDALVKTHTNATQETSIVVEAYAPKKADKPDSEIDWQGFRKGWENLQDTHDFYPLLGKFNVGREQAFSKIGADFAFEVENTATRQALELARDKNCEIMVFVGNRGCLQIHTGPVKKLMEKDNWYNVLDPTFNLHLSEDKIARTWITRKPTEDGIVTAVELFDAAGDIIATLFGKRKPGIPELTLWREIVSEIQPKALAHAA